MTTPLPDATRPPPAWAIVLLAAATLLQVAAFAWYVPGNDLTHDLLEVAAIADGQGWPLLGPHINNAVYLGPAWFWLLALIHLPGANLTTTMLVVGALAMLKVPLAWRLGQRLEGPWLALVAAALMLLPGWGVLHSIQPTHTLLLEMLLVATWLPLLSLWRGEAAWHWAAFGALAGLALHSHPVSLALLLPAAVTAWRRRARWRGDGAAIAAGIGLAVLPLLPMLLSEWRAGWPVLHVARDVAAVATADVAPTPWQLLVAMTAGSVSVLHAWLPPAPAWLASAGVCVVVAVAVVSLWRLRHDPVAARRSAVALALFVLALLWLPLLRNRMPFYMALLAWPPLMFGLALTIASAARHGRSGRWLAMLGVAAALLAASAAACGVMMNSRTGIARLPLSLITDVRRLDAPRVRVALMPIHALDAVAAANCGAQTLHVHGELAALVDYYQAVPFRWNCPRMPLQVMGADAGDRHWAGTTPNTLRLLGVADADWHAAVRLRPGRVIAPRQGLPPVVAYRYPARDLDPRPAAPRRFAVAGAADEAVSVYSPLFPYDGATTPVATCDGVPVTAIEWTNAGALFLPPQAGTGCQWEVLVESRAAEQVDIVMLPYRADVAAMR